VIAAVRKLLQQGSVCEASIGESNGGRKPILVRFSPENRFIVGVAITNSSIKIAETNLEAKARKQKVFPIYNLISKFFIAYLLKSITQFLKEYSDLTKCIEISIIAPGIIDVGGGVICENTKLKLKNIPLKEIVEKRFKLKT